MTPERARDYLLQTLPEGIHKKCANILWFEIERLRELVDWSDLYECGCGKACRDKQTTKVVQKLKVAQAEIEKLNQEIERLNAQAFTDQISPLPPMYGGVLRCKRHEGGER